MLRAPGAPRLPALLTTRTRGWAGREATLSGRRGRDGRAPGSLSWNAGGDSPAWGRKRQKFEPSLTRVPGTVPYAELHCHSNFSFLEGASHVEELAARAKELGAVINIDDITHIEYIEKHAGPGKTKDRITG